MKSKLLSLMLLMSPLSYCMEHHVRRSLSEVGSVECHQESNVVVFNIDHIDIEKKPQEEADSSDNEAKKCCCSRNKIILAALAAGTTVSTALIAATVTLVIHFTTKS